MIHNVYQFAYALVGRLVEHFMDGGAAAARAASQPPPLPGWLSSRPRTRRMHRGRGAID